jgi:hypothetical protein
MGRGEVRNNFLAVRVILAAIPRSGPIEMVLDRGRSVRVEPGFDGQVLRDVLGVLEERPC